MATSAERIRAYRGPALFSLGLRPFFLLGAIWAAIAVPLWIVTYALGPGALPVEAGLVFHVHEMVFGYGSAIVAGFLLTAVPNWTGRLPVCGPPLMVLVALWVAGRAAMLFQPGPVWLPGAIECTFLVVFAGLVWREVIAGQNTRNLKVAGVVSVLALANIAFHWTSITAGGLPQGAIRTGFASMLFLILLIGGRITPSFTRNWLGKRGGPMPAPFGRYDGATLIASLVALVAWSVFDGVQAASALLLVAGVMNIVRLGRWQIQRTLAEPLVTILHVGYGWAALALLLLGLSGLFPASVPRISGVHAVGAGAIGVMTLAVMTRASLGHTGHVLKAGWGTVLIYAFVNSGALARVAAPFFEASLQMQVNHIASVLWAGAFALFAIVYGPRLLAPRPDRTS
ncbi:MAG: short-chain dehydrogenase [Hyphomonadaceae bacterium BRH_c29]|nr:MAG: short-chain dehydrogenase [Hyphomonadaceae bacterium BRH_c29]